MTKKLVEATDATQSYVAEDYLLDKSYMNATNENNFSAGAFASKYDHVSTLILSKESGYNVSSILGYKTKTEIFQNFLENLKFSFFFGIIYVEPLEWRPNKHIYTYEEVLL